MTTKAGKSSRTSSTRTKRNAAGSAPKKGRVAKQVEASGSGPSDRFVVDLLVRGEAAKPDRQGKLPLDATHAIVKDKDGQVTVKRARLKLY